MTRFTISMTLGLAVVFMASCSQEGPGKPEADAGQASISPVRWDIELDRFGPGVHTLFMIAEVRPIQRSDIVRFGGRLVWSETHVDLCTSLTGSFISIRGEGPGWVHIGDGFETNEQGPGCPINEAMSSAFRNYGLPREACIEVETDTDLLEYCAPLQEVKNSNSSVDFNNTNGNNSDSCIPGTRRCECRDGECNEGLICVDDDGGAAADGFCTSKNACNDPSVAAAPCESNCTFDPGSIDCTSTCQSILEHCPYLAACPVESLMALFCGTDDGLRETVDLATCVSECEDSKAESCDNISYGCWASEGEDCELVPECVRQNL